MTNDGKTCEAVKRELSAPRDQSPAGLVAHLATCGDCSAWHKKQQAFDAIWDQTRPAGLDAADDPMAWSAAWQATRQGAEALRQDRADTRVLSSRRYWTFAALAQAAIILVAVGLWAKFSGSGQALQPGPTPMPVMSIVLNEGQLGFLHVDGQERRIENIALDSDGDDDLLAADFQILNHMEGLAP